MNFRENPADLFVITFSSDEENDHFDLITRCLLSILNNTDSRAYRLHIGCNNLSKQAMSFVDNLVADTGARKYVGHAMSDSRGKLVFPKYPLMRRMYASMQGDWLLWFDDDIYVTADDWLERVETTINQNHEADQFGRIANIALPLSAKEEWIDKAKWSKPGKIQYKEMPEGRMIVSPFVLGGFYALSRRAMQTCQIPDERLFHNFGDWTTGMALHHNGFQIAPFSYGIMFGDAPRRGIHKDRAVESDTMLVLSERQEHGRKVSEWKEAPLSETPAARPTESPRPSLPLQFSMKTLEKNLDALVGPNPNLVKRICLPVDGGHVRFLPDGNVMYERNRNLIPFTMTEDQVSSTVALPPPDRDIFLFGAGLGEQFDYLLSHCPNHRISLWDRDPWLLRLLLMRKDYSSLFRAGQVRAALGVDLLEWMNGGNRSHLIAHPLLKSVYETEYLLFQEGLSEKRAILCTGGLFVDDVAQVLRESGYSLFSVDLKRLSREEIAGTIKRFDPQFLFAVNYTNGLSELCQELGVPWICWEIDPAADHIKPLASSCDSGHVFTYRSANTAEFKTAGFSRVEYLPLAANPKRRVPTQLSPDERPRYQADLSFVGSSMISQAAAFKTLLLQKYKEYRGGDPAATQEGNALLERILLLQRQDPAVYEIPRLLEQHWTDFLEHLRTFPTSHDPYMLVAEIAAAEKRINYIAALARFGVKVWGDEGWRMTERFGVKYMGKAGHDREINKIYGASLINVDIHRIYQADIVTMRVFDVLACGGFVLSEYSPALEELFAIGKEVETYHTVNELLSKTAFYMEHRDRALEIAAAGSEAVVKRHTIQARVGHMLHRSGLAGSEVQPQ